MGILESALDYYNDVKSNIAVERSRVKHLTRLAVWETEGPFTTRDLAESVNEVYCPLGLMGKFTVRSTVRDMANEGRLIVHGVSRFPSLNPHGLLHAITAARAYERPTDVSAS